MNPNDDPSASEVPVAPPIGEIAGLDPGELFARALQTVQPSPGATAWTPPEPEALAALLPQYRIESLLGHGGMGAVYKGWQPTLDRAVAIKLLPAEIAADADFIARFQREARTLAQLQHPGIVTVYDFGQTSEGHFYFVMEYVSGTDLSRILHGPGLNPKQALAITGQICDALAFAHSQGVIHRDIKPANILLTKDGRAKLADFGLARPASGHTGGITQSNMVMGTPDYMAPEQRIGEADQRADIYALGVMLYEMLTGQRPQGIFALPSEKVSVDARIDEVVVRALQQEPARRYQRVSEMKTDVDHIRNTPPGGNLGGTPLGGTRPAVSQTSGGEGAPLRTPSLAPRLSPSMAIVMTGVVTAVVLLVVFGDGVLLKKSIVEPPDFEAESGTLLQSTPAAPEPRPEQKLPDVSIASAPTPLHPLAAPNPGVTQTSAPPLAPPPAATPTPIPPLVAPMPVVQAAAPPLILPPATPTPAPSLLPTFSKQIPNITAWILAPLDQTVPADIRQNLTFLREDLVDESKQKPAASAGAYRLGAQLCQSLLAILDERTQTQARAGFRGVEAAARTGVTSQALEARRNYMMSWPQYARETSQRAELKTQAINNAALMAERPKLEWSQRTSQLSKGLDNLYAQFRAALRQDPK